AAETALGDASLRASIAATAEQLYRERFHPTNTVKALRAAAAAANAQPPIVLMLVNGDESSAMGHRARALAAGIAAEFDVRIEYRSGRKVQSMCRFFRLLRRTRPAVTYVLDMSFSGVLAGCMHRILSRRNRLIIDT